MSNTQFMQRKPVRRKPLFISWRWRIVIPVFGAVLFVSMLGAYFLAANLSGGIRISQDSILLESVRGMANRSDTLYQQQVQEAQRIAFTVGVPESVQRGEVDVLQESLEAMARVADADSIILTDNQGVEVLGVQRVLIPNVDDYAVNTGTELIDQQIVQTALRGESGEAAMLRTPEGILLFVSVPLRVNNDLVGTVLVGNHMMNVVDDLRTSAASQMAVYGPDGNLMETTLDITDAVRSDLNLPTEIIQQALNTDGRTVPVRSQQVGSIVYRVAYSPFNFGGDTLGMITVLLPDSVPFATEIGRQLTGLMSAATMGVVVVVVFVGLAFFTGRVEKVQKTADALARGDSSARTGMRSTDEASAVGAALDRYANHVQQEQDALQQALKRQRREANHLVSVLESIPDGVIVQDMQGQVTLVNDSARRLLGSQRVLEQNITAQDFNLLVNQTLGPALAPGVYALGDPQRVDVGNKMLTAQAAAITSVMGERVGTVVLLRDVTDFVRKEQEREALLKKVEEQVGSPLSDLAQTGMLGLTPVDSFAREITKRAVALQKLVVEMRELTDIDVQQLEHTQKPIRLDTLVWTIANEWRQIAQAADLKLNVLIQEDGLHVLGDEKRLRWAIGNLVDNAIKYTPPGGTVTLEINEQSNQQALMRVRDSGVGIASDEITKVTARFYRGNPTMRDGEIIRTPGLGQGLYVARQIIETHGGYLKVRSKPHVGTAIYFSLPVTSAQSMDVPVVLHSFEGETVRLPEDYFSDRNL